MANRQKVRRRRKKKKSSFKNSPRLWGVKKEYYLSYVKNLNFTAFCQLVLVILAEKHQSSAEKYLKLISTRLETYFY